MNVSNVGQSIGSYALLQTLAAVQTQVLASIENTMNNQLASLDPNVGQNLDISV